MAPIQQTNTSSCHDTVESTSTRVHSGKPSDMHSHITSGRRQRELGVSQPGVSQPESAGVREALLLPITCRGHFYDDTFFSEARQHFDTAVRDVLDRLGQRSALDDDLTSYRRLRQSNLTEASQAVSVTEDDKHHQVVLDVRDFLSGDVKVKMIDENELVVEGSVEQRKEGSVSKKSFRRLFSFPGLVRPEAVTSTMSSDGVLTVTVPKKESLTRMQEVNVSKINNTVDSTRSTETKRAKVNNFTSSPHHGANSELSKESKPIEKKEYKPKKSVQFNADTNATTSTSNQTPTNTSTSGRSSPDQTSDFLLPISHRGLFFHDSFFTEAHQDFEAAVKRIVDSWEDAPASDHMTSYRRLRERDLKEENQAVSVTENHQSHKVVLDVRDFLSGDVKVKMVDENELVVEGSVEQRKEGSVSKKRFRRLFSFPGLVRPEAVTSTMSSDGVLTVTVPKKEHSETTIVSHDSADASKINVKQEVKNLSSNVRNSKLSKLTSAEARRSSLDGHSNVEAQKTTTKSSTSRRLFNASSESKTLDSSRQETATNNFPVNAYPWGMESELPVYQKGPFLHDSFFQDARENFQAAVKEILTKFTDLKTDTDDLCFYRSLRECHLSDDNQALKVTETPHTYQVVIDVRDFMSGDVKVKAVGQDEVVVEGRVEKTEGNFQSTKNFSRRFNLPGMDLEAITSAVSSDGVLTIKASKSSRDARVKTTSQAERTFHHAGASENSSSSSSIQEESCHEKKEERAGLTSHTFTKTSSHQSYTSQM